MALPTSLVTGLKDELSSLKSLVTGDKPKEDTGSIPDRKPGLGSAGKSLRSSSFSRASSAPSGRTSAQQGKAANASLPYQRENATDLFRTSKASAEQTAPSGMQTSATGAATNSNDGGKPGTGTANAAFSTESPAEGDAISVEHESFTVTEHDNDDEVKMAPEVQELMQKAKTAKTPQEKQKFMMEALAKQEELNMEEEIEARMALSQNEHYTKLLSDLLASSAKVRQILSDALSNIQYR
ncbi:hypothetical protein [Aestuariispira insulae]|uniref:Uncharacterized protein n=1 Tax=Aestuariispira insulae TaxID=1461337 RepID=A0A3D9H2I5_9PROT|nr:hypothetical protein [Aestuariispira insulae]RED43690.1 hypothetical protein DFP90_1211 [Aestuariispira insulae]